MTTPGQPVADWTRTTPEQLLASHLMRPPTTRRSYASDLKMFAAWMAMASAEQAVKHLVEGGVGQARRLLGDWVAECQEAGKALGTARRRVSGLLALIRKARDFGVIEWSVERIKLPAAKVVRDTRGPSRAEFDRLLAACEARHDAIGYRDKAMLMLLMFSALRSSELLSIRWPTDCDCGRFPKVNVKAKGKWERAWKDMAIVTKAAVLRWVEARGDYEGPLFVSMRPNGKGDGVKVLTYAGLYDIVKGLGRTCSVRVHPHGLRHTGISQAYDLTGDVGYAQALAGHKDSRVTAAYLDRRRTMRQATEIVAAGQFTLSRFQSNEPSNDN